MFVLYMFMKMIGLLLSVIIECMLMSICEFILGLGMFVVNFISKVLDN